MAIAWDELIEREWRRSGPALQEDYDHLGRQLKRRGIDIAAIEARAAAFVVAVPSWGVATGGTRFARFAGPGEPRNVFEKIDDCHVINRLCCVTPDISLHIPWDEPDDPAALRSFAAERGLTLGTTNSNTFEDQPGQAHSYKFGSLSHTEAAVREQAVAHNLHCIDTGREARRARALGLDRRRRQLPGPAARAPGPRSLPRQHARHLRRPPRRAGGCSSSTSSTSPRSTRRSSTTGASATTAPVSWGRGPSRWWTSATTRRT